MIERFGGVWELDPERSHPSEGPTPRRAVYTLLSDGQHVHIHARWTDEDGQIGSVAFQAALDGDPQELEPGIDLIARFEDGAFVTEVIAEGSLMQTARRSLDDTGSTMTVHQAGANGESTSVYHRAAVKQVIVYRRDLNMRKGKIAAQVAHASMRVLLAPARARGFVAEIPLEGPVAWWVRRRFTKVVLSVEGEEELLRIHQLAQAASIPNALITDAGRTEFAGVPTKTTVAVGPWVASEIDAITGPRGAVPTKLA